MTGDRPGVVPVIMCGGAGARLWPLSRRDFPKQFLPLVGEESLFAQALGRAQALEGAPVLCVTNEAHRFLVDEALEAKGISGDILIEPEPKSTAPALCVAALAVADADPDTILVCLPADHHMPDLAAFLDAIHTALPPAAAGWWVALGITPAGPSEAYGYITSDGAIDGFEGASRVASFVEKPCLERARDLVRRGSAWNAGIFVVTAATLLNAVDSHAPDVGSACRDAFDRRSRDGRFVRVDAAAFGAITPISIDHAVLEHEERVATVPYRGAWSDIGSWTALVNLHPGDGSGNRAEGDVALTDCRNTYVRSPERLIAVVGVDDLIIVDSADALLVVHRDKAEEVKGVVEALQGGNRPEYSTHRKVHRPWGASEGLDRGERYQVKRITVKPGAALSLQYHHHRAEHWVVVRGTAKVTRGGQTFVLAENQSTYIAAGEPHRLENPGTLPLELIEVQSGSYLGEDDIVRIEDAYGRIQT